mgnify:CR=1 FL=1
MRAACALHASVRVSCFAQLRTQFPRIVVKYEATEDGVSHPLALPEMPTAFLTAADVEEMDA